MFALTSSHGKFTVYVCSGTKVGGAVIVAERRYTDFQVLYRVLVAQYPDKIDCG